MSEASDLLDECSEKLNEAIFDLQVCQKRFLKARLNIWELKEFLNAERMELPKIPRRKILCK